MSRRRTTSFADQTQTQTTSESIDPRQLTGVTVADRNGIKITTVAVTSVDNDAQEEIQYTSAKVIGNGSFGVVFEVHMYPGGEKKAVKKVLQDRRFKNRELQTMKMLNHPNIVKMEYFFYSNGTKKEEIYLNLVLEFVPQTIYQYVRQANKARKEIPSSHIKLFSYQMLRALAYLHSLGICHRDIKPQNMLLDVHTGVLKICDFGSAKMLVAGQPNVAYICSRFYRAPELIFGARDYSCSIDVWSTGCVIAELLLAHPIFPGESGVDQLVEIVKLLGTPTAEQIKQMNPNYTDFKFPQIQPVPWHKVFRKKKAVPEAINLVSQMLCYVPSKRITMEEAMQHPFFDQLKLPDTTFGDRPLPPLFDDKENNVADTNKKAEFLGNKNRKFLV